MAARHKHGTMPSYGSYISLNPLLRYPKTKTPHASNNKRLASLQNQNQTTPAKNAYYNLV